MKGIGTDPRDLATQYIEAVGGKKLDVLASLLHAEFEFGGNVAPGSGADAWVAAIRRLSPIIVRNEIRKVFVDGNEVCILYDFVTPVCPVPCVERLAIEGGVVRSTWLLFDKSRWPEVMQELQRRAAA